MTTATNKPISDRPTSLKSSWNKTKGHSHDLPFQEYVDLNYRGYVQICNRCGIKPFTKSVWLTV